MTGGGGGSESLRILFLEAVYGFRVSFLTLSVFLEYEVDVMAVSGAVFVLSTKIIALKTSVKSVAVAFIVNYSCM